MGPGEASWARAARGNIRKEASKRRQKSKRAWKNAGLGEESFIKD